MSNQTILYFMAGIAALFLIIVIVYVIMQKKLGKSSAKRMRELRQGTKEKKFTSDVIYQKLYVIYNQIPFLKRYVKKLRRKIEIISIEDEYITRKQTARVISKGLLIVIPITLAVFIFTKGSTLVRVILLMFEVFFLIF